MIGWILGGVAAALLAFVAVLLVRTLRFVPKDVPASHPEAVTLDREHIVESMSQMIRCRTVSYRDRSLEDKAEFARFRALLAERYPLIHKACSRIELGETGVLYHLAGRSAERPSVCMAHYDVVPVEEDGWSRPAFEGFVEDGCLWGRGTLDTKGTLCGVMEALEYLLSQGYVPANDLYLSFSGDEEIDGGSCEAIVSYLQEHGIVPDIVVDEGGAVVDHVFPGVPDACALIGIAEKGGVNLEFTLNSRGGHASTPPPHTPIGELSRAVTRIEDKPFARQLTKPVAMMFDTLGRHSSFAYRLIFANLWCFLPLLDAICRKSGGELNAMMRTTVAVTRMEGSKAYNVLPPKASFGLNMRLMGKDTVASATAYLKRTVDNDRIEVRVVSGMDPSPVSDTACEAWNTLSAAIRDTWQETIVSPYLMMACSDSRHYCRISKHVYRFSPMRLSKEERAMIHGNDERIPVDTLVKTVEFYTRLLTML